MNADIKKNWITALRSGDYKQGKGYLRDHSDQYCCLGVLCDLYRKALPGVADWGGPKDEHKSFMGEDELPPREVLEWAGFDPGDDRSIYVNGSCCMDERCHAPRTTTNLACLNDMGKTFGEIADIIEEQL